MSAIAIVASMTACSFAPKPTAQETSAKLIMSNVPEWFTTIPVTDGTMRAVGDGVSSSMTGAIGNARAAAFESICHTSGSVVRSQTKSYRQDTEKNSQSISTTATRNFCPDVDVTGAVVEKQTVIRDGERFRAFVLVGLSSNAGDTKRAKAGAADAFVDLDKVNKEYQERAKQ